MLHIGDSYTNDVQGAAVLGIRTVWLNRLGRKQPVSDIQPDAVCAGLDDVQQLLLQWNAAE